MLLFAWTEPDFQEVTGASGGGLLTSALVTREVAAFGVRGQGAATAEEEPALRCERFVDYRRGK